MAQIAKTEAEKATNTVKDTIDTAAQLGKQTADTATEVAREAAGKAEHVARSGLQAVRRTIDAAAEVEQETVRRAAQGTAELGQVVLDLINEQTRHNVEVFKALTQAVNWQQVTELQRKYLRESFERAATFSRRYVEVNQAVLNSALSMTREQVRKAA